MKNVTNKSKQLFLLFGSFFLCVSLLIAGANRHIPNRIQGVEPSYSITMNSSNAPTSETFYTSAEKTIRYSTFEYIGARASVGSHVELNSTGYLGNKANSQITSITSIQANFITSGTLTLATSFDGINYTQTTITSGAINQTSTLPYHFRLTANSAIVTIQSVTITYSCAPHTTPIDQQSEYNITVKDFKAKDTSSDLSTLISADVNTYFSSDITLSSVVGSKIFANATTATNFKMGSGSAGGTITFNFPSLKISQVIVNAYKYSGDNNTKIKVTTSADSTGSSLSITASTATNYNYNLLDTTTSTSLTLTGESGRFHLESLKIISAGSTASPIETGFYASDSKAATYKVNDVYSTTNGITASVAMTSGSSIPVNYNADGISGYKYVVKNASNSVMDATKVFPSTGTYYVVISYKSYAPITITLTVSAAPQVTLTSVSAVDAKTTYKLGDIYDHLNKLVVTATYSDSSTATISYDPTGVNGYTIYCLDPNANDFYTSNPFSLAGDYLLTVTYKGIESNDVDITVTSETGPVNQAIINVLNNSVSDNTTISNPAPYLSATGVTISNATATNVYGGNNSARLRFSSSNNSGSMTITFSSSVVITSVSISVAEYNTSDIISINVATSANTNGQSLTLSTASGTLTYTAFANDTQASNSITISSPKANRFYLYSISLGLSSSAPINMTGVSMKSATTLATGGTEVLVPTILPSNANPVPNLSWTTDNSSVATVSNGTITGVGVGTTTIRVTATQGPLSFSAACTVTVTAATNYSVKSMNYDYQDYMDNNYYNNMDSSPTKGDVNFLVIPVELAGYPMTEATRTRIQKAYFGTEAETGWHSVASFYKQESNGRLNISGTVAPIYKTTYGASITEDQTTSLVTTATNWYKTNYSNNNGKEFDADSDGYIDGVILIYSAPNGTNNNDNLWAYCYWTSTNSSLTSPTANTYFWASYDFMDESPNATIDAHTYIHEAGHVFGLDDYYNYDSASKYGAAGGFNMQDYNVGEHDPYSRVALGWIDPIVPTGNTTLTIAPGEAIILSPNDLSSSSPFDEYLILDVYSPTGLNQFDSTYKYGGSSSGYPKGPNVTGIRVWHVDARLMKNYSGSGAPTLATTITAGNDYLHAMSNSTNSDYGSMYASYRNYKLLHLIQRGGTNTYQTGGQFSSTDVWGVGHTFSMSQYASFFVNSGKLNSNTSLPYSFSVTAINGTSVTLSITKS